MLQSTKHAEKMDFLIEKGMMLLWRKGYNATSVKDIVEAAQVPKGSFYFYFDSKEDFAVKALEMYFSKNFPPALEILQDKTVGPKQRLINFYEFRAHIIKEEFDCKMGCMGCNMANEMAEHSEAIRKTIENKVNLVKGHITEVVEEAQSFGEMDNSIDAVDWVNFVEDAGRGAMVSMKEMDSSYSVDNFVRMVKRLL